MKRWLLRGAAAGGTLGLGLLAALAFSPQVFFPDYGEAAARLDDIVAAGHRHPFRASRNRTFAALALVAQEDRRLFERKLGEVTIPWDLRACFRAAVRNLSAGRVQEGCSTLAMQLAKLALPQRPRGRRLATKFLQMRLAARTAEADPDTLVSAYLRVLPCASSHARGLEACARARFGRPLAELLPAEAMLLASAVQAPGRDLQPTEAARSRARARLERVLSAAAEMGFVSVEQVELLRAQPLAPIAVNLDRLRALEAGHDPELTETLIEAVAAARANALRKQGGEEGGAIAIAGAIFDVKGRIRAQVGDPAWLHRPLEAGSWVKPFVVEALLEAGLGRSYLAGDVEIPLHVPLVTRDGRRWTPRNAVDMEEHTAVPMAHVMRSVNTGTLASLLYAFVYLPPEESRAVLGRYLSPQEQRRFERPLDRRLSLEMASAYAGAALDEADVPGLPGYRQISLGATRMVLRGMRRHIPKLEVPHEDLAALLGVVRAPAEDLARGLGTAWLTSSGGLTPTARLMADYASQGTLRWLNNATPAVYKTATAERNAGVTALVFDRCRGEPLVVSIVALRPSGAPITPVQGATLGVAYPRLLSRCRLSRPDSQAVSMTYEGSRSSPEWSGGQ